MTPRGGQTGSSPVSSLLLSRHFLPRSRAPSLQRREKIDPSSLVIIRREQEPGRSNGMPVLREGSFTWNKCNIFRKIRGEASVSRSAARTPADGIEERGCDRGCFEKSEISRCWRCTSSGERACFCVASGSLSVVSSRVLAPLTNL